jgi:hypothetical protein
VGFGVPPEEEENEEMDQEQLKLHAQLTKRQSFNRLDMKEGQSIDYNNDNDGDSVEKKPMKPAKKKHLTDEEKEAELNKKGADKAKEWLDGNFAFKNVSAPVIVATDSEDIASIGQEESISTMDRQDMQGIKRKSES